MLSIYTKIFPFINSHAFYIFSFVSLVTMLCHITRQLLVITFTNLHSKFKFNICYLDLIFVVEIFTTKSMQTLFMRYTLLTLYFQILPAKNISSTRVFYMFCGNLVKFTQRRGSGGALKCLLLLNKGSALTLLL